MNRYILVLLIVIVGVMLSCTAQEKPTQAPEPTTTMTPAPIMTPIPTVPSTPQGDFFAEVQRRFNDRDSKWEIKILPVDTLDGFVADGYVAKLVDGSKWEATWFDSEDRLNRLTVFFNGNVSILLTEIE